MKDSDIMGVLVEATAYKEAARSSASHRQHNGF
jgi:hypothetical protein